MKNTIGRKEYLVIAFHTTAMAYYMDKLKKDNNLDGRLIPLPWEISAGCGAAFATQNFDIEYWKNFMQEHKVTYETMKVIVL